jgi:hypothetical protein
MADELQLISEKKRASKQKASKENAEGESSKKLKEKSPKKEPSKEALILYTLGPPEVTCMSDPASLDDEFLKWIGISITAWAEVEVHLFEICKRCLGTRNDRAAIVYYRTPSINSRLELVDELVRTVLPKSEQKSGSHPHPDVKEWGVLRKDIGKLLRTRNRIAHHPIKIRDRFGVPGGIGLLQAKKRFELHISDAERFRCRTEDVEPLKQDDLVKYCELIVAVATRAEEFLRSTLPKHF